VGSRDENMPINLLVKYLSVKLKYLLKNGVIDIEDDIQNNRVSYILYCVGKIIKKRERKGKI
jgi:hypothetical protein